MRSAAFAVATLGALGGAVGCAHHAPVADDNDHPFACRDRVVSYTATHHMDADELGVEMTCADGPHIKRWETDRAGHRKEQSYPLTPGQFDHVWSQIDGTGWQYMHDCVNSASRGGGKNEPIYSFNVGDDQAKQSFACQALNLPSPYNLFVDPLDQLVAKHNDSDGSDSP